MKFSETQTLVLRALDGATAPTRMSGSNARTVESLRKMGMVTYTRSRQPSPTYYYPGGSTLVLHVSLTREGGDFIYNGGLDQ